MSQMHTIDENGSSPTCLDEGSTIMVTGGMGFIGSNFIRHMLEAHPEFNYLNVDKLTYAGNPENLRDLENQDNYRFLKADICDKEAIGPAMGSCDAVVHFAAESHVDRSLESAGEFIDTNVTGTFVLLQAALNTNVKRFVMISTDEVYGDIPPGSFSIETDSLLPRNPYSASKVAADRLAYSYHEAFKLPVMITRSSNNYGPYQFPEKLIPHFITNLIQGKKVPLYGDGMNIRDWLYVGDNCRAIGDVLFHGKGGEVYNIGGGNERTNIEITNQLLHALGKDSSMIRYVEDRKGHDRRYALKCGKITEELGWEPSMDFEAGLKLTVSWYLANEDWWRTLLD
jgi:dTDP-glucose 4,6-dehydratase